MTGTVIPVTSSSDFVIDPLLAQPGTTATKAAVHQCQSASAGQQTAWASAYEKALGHATFPADGSPPQASSHDH